MLFILKKVIVQNKDNPKQLTNYIAYNKII